MHKIKRPIIFILISAAIIGILAFACYLNDVSNYKKAVADITYADIDIANIPDGVYDGAYDVGYISAKVEVLINNGTIEKINLIEHKNEKGSAAEVITDNIIQEQKIDVDAISGATNSSRVIKKAVENALIQK
ncbi:FMN-binding protein [Acetobacterium bakii]|uniref:FMN-binding protein n=1 Tax=Acetobacterium bakii TaxID=52689 RepID=A0A0L6U0B0_9FIRM|nr:FMN-binding protein [Acetobacterium bakii]KNZ41265.1 FMN-binding protein [Acetobacterium bakii]